MWGIENPWRVFQYVYTRDMTKSFNFMCIINNTKWNTFTNTNELLSLAISDNKLKIDNIRIKNPDNPAKLIDAKLITFSI
ncbi:hypothetical protein SDC9_154215 [bioreactor metagenome]|uniref:Uncharacterized protein n=1 Tax=bioreactor metagenome TaxID=1076179 RepID=A0A645EY34_9ZZZZ